jgi:hypothetical protein
VVGGKMPSEGKSCDMHNDAHGHCTIHPPGGKFSADHCCSAPFLVYHDGQRNNQVKNCDTGSYNECLRVVSLVKMKMSVGRHRKTYRHATDTRLANHGGGGRLAAAASHRIGCLVGGQVREQGLSQGHSPELGEEGLERVRAVSIVAASCGDWSAEPSWGVWLQPPPLELDYGKH